MKKQRGEFPGPQIKMVAPEWMPLVMAAGNKTRLAEVLFTSLSTIHRWSCLGYEVPPIKQLAIQAVCFKYGVKPPF